MGQIFAILLWVAFHEKFKDDYPNILVPLIP